jgi:hypothetical protein
MSVCQMLVVCLLLATAADDRQASEVPEESLSAPRWEIASEISRFQYEEPGAMKDHGILYGVAASYTRSSEKGLRRLEAGLAVGQVDYEGTLSDGTPYTMQGSHDYLLNLRLLWGRLWTAQGWDHQFYAGAGYRGLNDNSTQDPAGYDRQANYLYVPFGLKSYHELADQWQIGLGGELDVLLVGIQFSGVGDHSFVTNVQWPGFGARASMELRHRVKAADLAIAPFVQYWWVDESSTCDGWYEPRNHTLQYGLSLIWRF